MPIKSASDPNKYVFLGGDAMIRKNGKAVLVEFNNHPNTLKYTRLLDCIDGRKKCHRLVLLDPSSNTGYRLTSPTPATDVVNSEYLSTVFEDTIKLVMKLVEPKKIKTLREITYQSNDSEQCQST